MTAILIIGGVLALLLLSLAFKPETETVVTIKSKYGTSGSNRKGATTSYVAKRKKGKSGHSSDDWDYYDEDGDLIEDFILIALLFNTFEDGDWYGEYEYYVDDISYYDGVTTVEDVTTEKQVMESIEQPTIEHTSTIVDESIEQSETTQEHSFTEPTFEEPRFSEPSFDESDTKSSSSFDYSESSSSSSYDSGGSYDSGSSDFGSSDY